MKKLFAILVYFVFTFTIYSVAEKSASNVFSCGNYQYTILNDGTAEIIKYTGKVEELEIPLTLDNVMVTKINEKAFNFDFNLTRIIIPKSITDINGNPFSKCDKLKEIIVSPDNPCLATIDGVLFSKPDKRLICFPSGSNISTYAIPQGTKIIDHDAFLFNRLVSIYIPDTVTVIDTNPFNGCSSLEKISVSPNNLNFYTLNNILYDKKDSKLLCCPVLFEEQTLTVPHGITTIGDEAFSMCIYIENIILPETITNIGEAAFYSCLNLRTINIPKSTRSIGAQAFANCSSLVRLEIPFGITRIYYDTFFGCNNLSFIGIPNSVTYISDSAFTNTGKSLLISVDDGSNAHSFCLKYGYSYVIDENKSYDYVILSDGTVEITNYFGNDENVSVPIYIDNLLVTSIGNFAFTNCSDLVSIELPDSIINIGDNPFIGCSNLMKIEVSVEHKYLFVINGVLCSKPDKRLITYPCGFKDSLYIIPHEVQIIGSYSFGGCNNLNLVDIPDTVLDIGTNPFADCSSLINIRVSEDHQFFETSNRALISKLDKRLICLPAASMIDEYRVPSGIQSIGESAFYACRNLHSVYMPESITNVGDNSFLNCSNLEIIEFSDNIVIIGNYAFASCKNLTTVMLPSHLEVLGDYAFQSCTNLYQITMPNQLSEIGQGAYALCVSLEEIIIPHGVQKIGDGAFSDCESIRSIEIPDSITRIGDYVFINCNHLESVSISNNVTTIGRAAFSFCSSLESIIIPDSVQFIDDEAFSYCVNLNQIFLPDSVHSIGKWTFESCNTSLLFTVGCFSYAKIYCIENGFHFRYSLDYTIQKDGTAQIISFYGNSKTLYLPQQMDGREVSSIGERAFYYCRNFNEVIIPEGVTSIGNRAFAYCSNLEYITIPDSVVSIGYGVFDGCMDSLKFKIHHNTYIEQYCIDHGLEYVYSHDFDWLSE